MVKTVPFDPAELLDSPQAVAVYLEDAFASGNPVEISAALGTVARAKGMTALAEQSGLTRKGLYKALNPGGDPKLTTMLRVLNALGLRLDVRPAA